MGMRGNLCDMGERTLRAIYIVGNCEKCMYIVIVSIACYIDIDCV